MSKFRGKGLLGQKIGMTSIFDENGDQIPVTVVRAGPNVVLGLKPVADGEVNLRIGYGSRREKVVNKPELGVFKKLGVDPVRWIREFRVKAQEAEGLEVGTTLGAGLFGMGAWLDVTGTTKGKGFAGVMKRHNFAGGYASHGASVSHRVPGSIGQRQTPGRVFPGKRMAGHMGVRRCTVENLQVVRVDTERNLLLIRGAVPGAPGGQVIVRPSVKAAALAARKKKAPVKK